VQQYAWINPALLFNQRITGVDMKLFEQLINLLATGAILLTVVTAYLVANKLWIRKHEKVVAESINFRFWLWIQPVGAVGVECI
jgi:hypothetical protein